jgi:hypothetical protein
VGSHVASCPQTALLQKQLEQELVRLHREYAFELSRYAASFSPHSDPACEAVRKAFLRYFIERRYGRRIENARSHLYQFIRDYFSDPPAPPEVMAPPRRLDINSG